MLSFMSVVSVELLYFCNSSRCQDALLNMLGVQIRFITVVLLLLVDYLKLAIVLPESTKEYYYNYAV